MTELSPTLQYLNARTIASAADSNGPFPACAFSEIRTQPIVGRASDYQMSILRWTAVGLDLPVFIPSVQIGQSDPNLTNYAVNLTFQYKDTFGHTSPVFTATQPIIWVPQIQGEPTPPAPMTQQYVTSRFYWATSMQFAIDLFNTAFEAARTNLIAQFNAWYTFGPIPTVQTVAPRFVYEANKIRLYCDQYGFGGSARSSINTANDEDFNMAMNQPAALLFDHYDVTIDTNSPFVGPAVRFNVQDLLTNSITKGSKTYLIMDQDVSSSDAWSPVSSISFVTTQIPIQTEDQSPVNLVGESSVNQSANRNFFPVLTDFSLPLANGAPEYTALVSYAPQSQYRWTELISSDPLKNIQFQMFWRATFDGQLRPVFLRPGGSLEMKILLQHT